MIIEISRKKAADDGLIDLSGQGRTKNIKEGKKMKKFDVFLDYNNDLKAIQEVLTAAKKDGFVMADDFKKEIPTASELFAKFKKYYHGNSKMILHFFHNSITNKKEISIGNISVFKSYPQYKNIKILKIPSFIVEA